MLPPEPRLPRARRLLEEGHYFVIHAPRQTGKTTLIRTLARRLTAEGDYAAVYASCESAQAAGADVDRGVQAVLRSLELRAEELPRELRPPPLEELKHLEGESRLRGWLTRWAERCERPLVLLLDEVDALLDTTLISVLRQLRDGFVDRPARFPHAVALIGLRDVRDYKAQVRPDSQALGTASPFNVKSESLLLGNFSAVEVAELYGQHSEEVGQAFTEGAVARAYDLTRGQPWLVNALARQAVEELVTDVAQPITAEALEQAKEVLIRRRDTHLDSLVDRLREPRVRKVLEPILSGTYPADEVLDDDLAFVKDLGLVDSGPEGLEIANPIYREIVPRALTSIVEEYLPVRRASYVDADGRLLWGALLEGFVAFWRENGEWLRRRQAYSEAAAQLVFMAFLHKVVNGVAGPPRLGGGRYATIDREYAAGSGRVDLLVRWPLASGEVERFAVELKVWRQGEADPLERGLVQLASYLDRLGLDRGTLLVFDQRPEATPAEVGSRSEVERAGKQVTVLRL